MPTALLTGASTGIGRSTALRLAKAGWTVIAGVRNLAHGDDLLKAGGEALHPISLDVRNAEQIASAAQQARELAGSDGLTALINNAGIAIGGPLELMSIDELRRQFEVNVFGQVALTQALLGSLRRAQGRVVFISSVGGRVVTPFTAPYCASKYAVEAIGDALRVELRSSRVQVILIEPGSINTPIWDKAQTSVHEVPIPSELDEQYGHVRAAMAKVIEDTARRGIPPERVAETILEALSAKRPRTRYVVGMDARMMILARSLLSDRAFDWVLRRALKV